MKILRTLIPAALMLAVLGMPVPSSAAVAIGISVGIAPPPLPVYEQPAIPGYGYIWTPGYWAYGPDDYYWVPGTWVLPPSVGFLWTPPWWGWNNGAYLWHTGYWGPHVGFYGGIDYGYGYTGSGYEGGYWDHGRLYYNREANNIRDQRIGTTYSRAVTHQGSGNHVAFNGGTGGISAQATAQDQAAARERHVQQTALQSQHIRAAGADPSFRHSVNNGTPAITATSKPAVFGTVTNAATGAPARSTGVQHTGNGASQKGVTSNATVTTQSGQPKHAAAPTRLGVPATGVKQNVQPTTLGTQPKGVQGGQPRGVQGNQHNAVQGAQPKGVQGGSHNAVQGGQPKNVQSGQPKGEQGGQPKGNKEQPG
jgi:hypothetical protein